MFFPRLETAWIDGVIFVAELLVVNLARHWTGGGYVGAVGPGRGPFMGAASPVPGAPPLPLRCPRF